LIKVTILSPNHALRVGLREMLNARPDMKVVGEAREVEEIDIGETEVLVLASVSSARLPVIKNESIGILLLTDDYESVRVLFD
jgi:DNA-binding NarL/FixJ family response regulator